jgi:hypothetical protein
MLGAVKKGYSPIYDTTGDSSKEVIAVSVKAMREGGAARVVGHYATPLSVEEALNRTKGRAEAMSKEKGVVPRQLAESFVRVNHREVSRVWKHAAENGIFDELHLWKHGRTAR